MMEITPEIRLEFMQDAWKAKPREACGLLSIINGKQRYHPIKNIAENQADFLMDSQEYMAVEDFVESQAGDIVAIIHSHPASSELPSSMDKVGCEITGIPWAIYSTKTNEWHVFSPSGYKAPLIGREFKHGIFDCYSAMRDWYAETLSISLPDFQRAEKWWEKGQNLLMENFQSAGFEQVMDGSLHLGDVILCNIASPVVNHCAVYIGKDQVFHQTMNRLSSREIYGGLLKKNTRMVLRYKR